MLALDLNLLAVFDAVHELRSVTRAAERLGLTQSAVSHALRRLRDTVGDPLFVRSGGRLQPTARATEMAPAVREGLAHLRGAVAPGAFDPATATRRFTVAAGAYFCLLLVPALIAELRSAPGVDLRVIPVSGDLPAELDDGIVDLALGAFGPVPVRLHRQSLFGDELVWIAAAGSTLAARRLSTTELSELPCLQVGTPRPFGVPSTLMGEGGLDLRGVADTLNRRGGGDAQDRGVVYDALTAAMAVARSDLIARVPRRIAQSPGVRSTVAVLATEDDPPKLELAMVWSAKFDGDAGLAWLRAQIAAVLSRA